jgi:DNA polymerase type B, organellar and viral
MSITLELPAARSSPLTQTERTHRYRAKLRSAGKEKLRPFVGVDGEGGGVDVHGRQHYLLLQAGERRLFNDNRPLTTSQCLAFIVSLPSNPIHVGFSIGYDITQILRDLPPKDLDRLFADRGERNFKWTFYGNFAIDYLPRNYLRVGLVDPRTNRFIPGSSRTIYETFGFFQQSFLRSLHQFEVGTLEEREFIEHYKNARADFGELRPEHLAYCRSECLLLAKLMERFRAVCYAANIRPATWNGAGKLATALLRHYKTPRHIERDMPPDVIEAANAAYYGGRFEITATGSIVGPIYEYDIRSAYPNAMRSLPCLIHASWRHRTTERPPPGSDAICSVRFDHPSPKGRAGLAGPRLCGLPIRGRDGRLFWPRRGQGTYWLCEIEAAELLGCRVTFTSSHTCEPGCTCGPPFAWVQGLYDYRRSIGSKGAGYPIKLAINSLYGQTARRIGGRGPYSCYVHAGLITARTRAMLAAAASQCPDAVLMLATDGLYSTVPLALPEGGGLGQWDHAVHPSIHIVQPGLYWGPPRPKTRGIPRMFFERYIPAFEAVWAALRDELAAADANVFAALRHRASVILKVRNFTGLKLAHARGDLNTAGAWTDDDRRVSYDWQAKRMPEPELAEGYVRTRPYPGDAGLISVTYDPVTMAKSLAQELVDATEGNPDYADYGAPGFYE